MIQKLESAITCINEYFNSYLQRVARNFQIAVKRDKKIVKHNKVWCSIIELSLALHLQDSKFS